MAETETKPTWVAGGTFRKAMALAIDLHADQARKVDREPYLGHLLAVASNVIEAGGTEDQAAAALLHDAIEDRNATVDLISREVNARVAELVEACTEPPYEDQSRSGSWWTRKATYLKKLRSAGPGEESLLVALADKVNNCEKTARDFHRHVHHDGQPVETFWASFNAGDSCQHAWYQGLLDGFRATHLATERPAASLVLRLEHAVESLFGGREIVPCAEEHQHAPGAEGA